MDNAYSVCLHDAMNSSPFSRNIGERIMIIFQSIW